MAAEEIADNYARYGCHHIALGRQLRSGARHEAAAPWLERKLAGPSPVHDPVHHVADVARSYNASIGLPDPHAGIDFHGIRQTADRIHHAAREYANLPRFDKSATPHYDALQEQVHAQYKHLTGSGIDVQPVDHDPYSSMADMAHDLHHNGRLQVLKSESTPSPDFYLPHDTITKFRAVHDAFGHAAIGRDFDAHGEEAAFHAHARMFTPMAQAAMATGTRGANGYVNVHNRFADQRMGLMHPSLWTPQQGLEHHEAKLPKTEKCSYCKQPATKRMLWAEGMAYIPTCDRHENAARHKIVVENNDEVVSVRKIATAYISARRAQCLCGEMAEFDRQDGWQHLDGSIGCADGGECGKRMSCPACSGTGEQGTGHECYACDGSGMRSAYDPDVDNANPENGLLVGRDDAKGIKPVTASASTDALDEIGRREHPNVDHYQSGGMGHLEGDESRSVVGFMPVHEVAKYREHNGYGDFQEGTPEHEHEKSKVDAIEDDIRSGKGITNPLMLEYSHKHGWGLLGEGNHRLRAAENTGSQTVPVRVVRNNHLGWDKEHGHGAPMEASPGWKGGMGEPYTPTDMHPYHFIRKGSAEYMPLDELRKIPTGDYGGVPLSRTRRAMEREWRHGTDTQRTAWREHDGPSGYLDHLQDQISRNGITKPIEIAQGEHGPYIHDGTHRALIAHENGIDPVPVVYLGGQHTAGRAEDYRLERHVQEQRAENYSGGHKTEQDIFYGRGEHGGVEKPLTYKDWLHHTKEPRLDDLDSGFKSEWDGFQMGHRHGLGGSVGSEELEHGANHAPDRDRFISGYHDGLEHGLNGNTRIAVMRTSTGTPLRVTAHVSGNTIDALHCPFCGSGSVTARSDGSIECSFCTACYTVQVQPQYAAFPQSVDGTPYPWPGRDDMGGGLGEDGADPAMGDPAMMGNPGDPNAPNAGDNAMPGAGAPVIGGGAAVEDPDDEDDEEGGDAPPWAKGGDSGSTSKSSDSDDDKKSDKSKAKVKGKDKPPFGGKKSSYSNGRGAMLSEEDFIRHLAIVTADDPATVAMKVKASRA